MKRGDGRSEKVKYVWEEGGGQEKWIREERRSEGVSQTWKADSGADCCLLDLK